MQMIVGKAITTNEGVIFTPFVANDGVGYRVTHNDGTTEWLTLVPTTDTGEGPDTSNVFAYVTEQGAGEPAMQRGDYGEAVTHFAFDPRPLP